MAGATQVSGGTLFSAILNWREAEAKAAEARGERMFLGKPEAWYENLHWFCANGHVSSMILKCEEAGDCCLACRERVCMGPPIGEREYAPILARLAQGCAQTPQGNQGHDY